MMKKRYIKSSYDPYTENFADFGFREIEELKDILTAWVENGGLPEDFDDEGVRPAFNRSSGNVFLTNDSAQVVMLTGDRNLESWYYTPYEGHEGFYDDLLEECDETWDPEDIQYMQELAEMRGDAAGIEKLQALVDSLTSGDEYL